VIYRATLNIDFTGIVKNEYQKLVAALLATGWRYLETTAFILETEQLARAFVAFELIAKQCAAAGTLSALTIHIQGSEDFGGVAYPAADNHPNAVANIRGKPWPEP